MSAPLMLGGLVIPLHAGAPGITDGKLGGGTGSFRLSGGLAVKMERWSKQAGSISAQGWMPPGLAGLDFSQPMELRSTKVRTVSGTGLVYELTGGAKAIPASAKRPGSSAAGTAPIRTRPTCAARSRFRLHNSSSVARQQSR